MSVAVWQRLVFVLVFVLSCSSSTTPVVVQRPRPAYVKVQYAVSVRHLSSSSDMQSMVQSFASALGLELSDITVLRIVPIQKLAFETGPKWRHFELTFEIKAPLRQTAISVVSQIKEESERPHFMEDIARSSSSHTSIVQIKLHDVSVQDGVVNAPGLTLVRGNFEISIKKMARWTLQKQMATALSNAFQVKPKQVYLEQIEPRPSLDRSDSSFKHFDVTFACNTTSLGKAFGIVSDIEYVRMSGNSSRIKNLFVGAGIKLAHIGFQMPQLILPPHVLLHSKQQHTALVPGETRLHPAVYGVEDSTQFHKKDTELLTTIRVFSRGPLHNFDVLRVALSNIFMLPPDRVKLTMVLPHAVTAHHAAYTFGSGHEGQAVALFDSGSSGSDAVEEHEVRLKVERNDKVMALRLASQIEATRDSVAKSRAFVAVLNRYLQSLQADSQASKQEQASEHAQGLVGLERISRLEFSTLEVKLSGGKHAADKEQGQGQGQRLWLKQLKKPVQLPAVFSAVQLVGQTSQGAHAKGYERHLRKLLLRVFEKAFGVPLADIALSTVHDDKLARQIACKMAQTSAPPSSSGISCEQWVSAHTHFYVHAADAAGAYAIASKIQRMRRTMRPSPKATAGRPIPPAVAEILRGIGDTNDIKVANMSFLAPALLLESDDGGDMNMSDSAAAALLGAHDAHGDAGSVDGDDQAGSMVGFVLGVLCMTGLCFVLRLPSNCRYIVMMARLHFSKWRDQDKTPVSAYDALAYTRTTERQRLRPAVRSGAGAGAGTRRRASADISDEV